MVTASGARIARVVLPRTRPNDVRKTAVIDPRRAIGRRALIVPVPAVRDPLVDATAHVEQAEGVCLKAPDLQELRRVAGIVASLAVGHADAHLVAPPELGRLSAARRIFPFGFARQPE